MAPGIQTKKSIWGMSGQNTRSLHTHRRRSLTHTHRRHRELCVCPTCVGSGRMGSHTFLRPHTADGGIFNSLLRQTRSWVRGLVLSRWLHPGLDYSLGSEPGMQSDILCICVFPGLLSLVFTAALTTNVTIVKKSSKSLRSGLFPRFLGGFQPNSTVVGHTGWRKGEEGQMWKRHFIAMSDKKKKEDEDITHGWVAAEAFMYHPSIMDMSLTLCHYNQTHTHAVISLFYCVMKDHEYQKHVGPPLSLRFFMSCSGGPQRQHLSFTY